MLWKQDVGSKQSLFHPISGFGIQFETISPSLHTTFPISTFSNTGKVSLWFSSFAETTFDFPSKQYQITVTSKPLIFKVSGRKLGNSIQGIELVELVVLWKYHILMWCELSLVSFLHRSILSTGKNCWTEVTYFKDRTTHCTYQIALNRFFSLWKTAKMRIYWFLILWEAGLAQILIPGYWPEDDIWWDNTDYEDHKDHYCNRES